MDGVKFMRMDASKMKLPGGVDVALIWGPLRIVVMYHIATDSIVARFDTMSGDDQYNCAFSSAGMADIGQVESSNFGWMCLPFALRTFLDGKAVKSREMAPLVKLVDLLR